MKRLLAVVAVSALALQAGAASITWEPAHHVINDWDIETVGTVHAAESAAQAATVHGVAFGTLGSSGNIDYGGREAYQYYGVTLPVTVSADYTRLLTGVSWDGTSANLYPFTINNLTVGQEYVIQVWATIGGKTVTDTFDDGNGNTIDLITDGASMAVGHFVADATSQSLTEVSGSFPAENPFFNAIQVRAIPEAASVGMIGLGAGLLLAARRFLRI